MPSSRAHAQFFRHLFRPAHSATFEFAMIRAATIEDLPAVCHLIRQLAKYARLEHEVAFDERRLSDHLFGRRPWAEALLAEEAGQVVGFALFFHNYSTFAGKPGLYDKIARNSFCLDRQRDQ